MKKRLLILAIVAVAVTAPVFALTTVTPEGASSGMNIEFIQKAVNLVVGIFAGGFCLLKAALDIFHAVRNSSEDQNGLKKAIGGFVLNVAILGGFMFVINYIFASMIPQTATGAASENFVGVLTGTLVPAL